MAKGASEDRLIKEVDKRHEQGKRKTQTSLFTSYADK